ncbi:hypothetical protein ANABIO32_18340 [Rossellomorea marisflavi]|uniref:hypothetical protein n=1 Tax=Rossellomorea marisflavi TaxID=189381 RepID=UPI0025C9A30C|nr:hypothetical protein [Rossellomorea marisflavi]GLI84134.1 hypothetical protein ANABIO32_18340 [Rossellomorea marisflavi]
MIIMINGAFGAGKTTLANALCKELPGSMIFDPEEVGYMLRNVIPEERGKGSKLLRGIFRIWTCGEN